MNIYQNIKVKLALRETTRKKIETEFRVEYCLV
jgi:hypothetical protein